jgi:predicted ester cyclase
MSMSRHDRRALCLSSRGSRRDVLAAGAGALAAFDWWRPLSRIAAAQEASPTACQETTPDENTALAIRWFDEGVSAHDTTVLDALLAPGVGSGTPTAATPAARASFAALMTSFPDLQLTVQQTVAEGDRVAVRWQAAGTDVGGSADYPATGRSAVWTGIDIFRFACGGIAESWEESDVLSRMRQLGLLPELGEPIVALPETVERETPPADCPAGTIAENRAVVQRWFADAVNPRRLDLLGEIVAPGAVLHATGFPDLVGPDDLTQLFSALFAGFSDLHFSVDEGPAEDNFVVERWDASGTNDGVFQGIAPTGRAMHWSGITMYRLACGKIAEIWTEADTFGRLRQLGVIGGTPVAATPTA